MIPRLEIEQQPSVINLDIKKHQFKLEKSQPQLEIKQEKSKLNITQDTVEIKIDSYPHNFDLGYKNIQDRRKEIAGKGKQVALQAIQTYAQEGDRLADIPFRTDEIAVQAREEVQEEKKELGLSWKRGPEIEVKAPELNVNYKATAFSFQTKRGNVKGILNWGQVEVKIEQFYKTEITVKGCKLNRFS